MDINTKRCTRCQQEKPMTKFSKTNGNKDGLNRWCRDCCSDYHKQRLKNLNYEIPKMQVCSKCNKEKDICEFTNDQYSKTGHHSLCRDCRSEHHQKYYVDNTNSIQQQNYRWQVNNPEKFKQSARNWSKSTKGIESMKKSRAKRLAIKRSVESTLTDEEWQDCLKYFGYKCAYCGSQENIQHDHFVPVIRRGAYTKGNIIVACSKCNSSKGHRNFFKWYPKQPFYDKAKETKILSYLGLIKQ